MKTLVISKNKFASLKEFILNKDIINTESKLYLWDSKINKKLLKIFFNTEGLYFENKLLTINSLIDAKDSINIEELVMPEKLVVVKNKVVGFSMPFIENDNLQIILNNLNIPISTKIDYLKQVGQLLERVKKNRPFNQAFYLSDVHEANFIYDKQMNQIRAVDLDSCKIANNKPSAIKYLSTNPNVDAINYKYIKDKDDLYKPNSNSEILCYIMMILNTISRKQINGLSSIEYFSYLFYLRDLGFSYELLDLFGKIYTGSKNVSPHELLDEISHNKNTPRAHYKIFEYINKKQR